MTSPNEKGIGLEDALTMLLEEWKTVSKIRLVFFLTYVFLVVSIARSMSW